MRKRIAFVFIIFLALLGFGGAVSAASATAAPVHQTVVSAPITDVHQVVPMGNGTANFYLSGSCHAGVQPMGVDLKATNWDNGANQTYHTAWYRSGVAYIVDGVYLDGVYKGKSSDMQFGASGHGRHTLKLVMHVVWGSNPQTCSFSL